MCIRIIFVICTSEIKQAIIYMMVKSFKCLKNKIGITFK